MMHAHHTQTGASIPYLPIAKPKWARCGGQPAVPAAVVPDDPELHDAENEFLEDLEFWAEVSEDAVEPPQPAPTAVAMQVAAPPAHGPLAGNVDPWVVCRQDLVAAQCQLEHKEHPRLKQILEQLNTSAIRRLPTCEKRHVEAVRRLAGDFPHCAAAIDIIARHLTLLAAAGSPLRLPALLLTGAPGVGKTEFARRVGDVLGMRTDFHSCAEITASFVITGNSRGWAGAQPGLVATAIADLEPGTAPLFVMDELDKIHQHSSFPPDRALLGLLERRTAGVFRDECLELELDTRPASWIFTCNRLDQVRPELRSRLRIVEIPRPTAEQMPAVVRSVERSLRWDTPAYDTLFERLGPEIVAGLSGHSPRILGRLLEEMFALACEDTPQEGGRRRIGSRHLAAALAAHTQAGGAWADPQDGASEGLRRPIGFMAQ